MNVLTHLFVRILQHADQATEPLIDFCLKTQRSFAVVPCCVFDKLFPHRRVPISSDRKSADSKSVTDEHAPLEKNTHRRVRVYGELINVLMRKDARIKAARLPLKGRNVVLYWRPDKSSASSVLAAASGKAESN